jgi:hypothetical protein
MASLIRNLAGTFWFGTQRVVEEDKAQKLNRNGTSTKPIQQTRVREFDADKQVDYKVDYKVDKDLGS